MDYTDAAIAIRQYLDEEEQWRLAHAVRYVLRRGGWPKRSCRPDHLRRIEADRALMAYLSCVQDADAWGEEIARVRQRQRERRIRDRSVDWGETGGGELAVSAVRDLVPTWREWGRLLLTAEFHGRPPSRQPLTSPSAN